MEGEEGKGVSRGGSIYLPTYLTLCGEMITGGCYVHVPMYMCMYCMYVQDRCLRHVERHGSSCVDTSASFHVQASMSSWAIPLLPLVP